MEIEKEIWFGFLKERLSTGDGILNYGYSGISNFVMIATGLHGGPSIKCTKIVCRSEMEIDYDHDLTVYEGPPKEMTPFLWAMVALLLEKAPDQFMEKDLYPFITQKRFNMVLVRLWKAGVLKRYDTKSGKSPKWELDIERLRAMPLNPEIRALVEERARRQLAIHAQNSQEPWHIGVDGILTHVPSERRWVRIPRP